MLDDSYKFEIPAHHKSIIKVIGVGGGGSNAVNHMYSQGIKDVEFVVCNTDAQALHASAIPNKLQIGVNLTEGLGAGANPEKGRNAALESKQEIRELLNDDTKMVFITAGMGGGTGTGAAPVIAEIAKEMDILTVGIITVPFLFEGKKKTRQAQQGIEELKRNCDTVLIILNDRLRDIYGNLSISQAFAEADNVLTTAAKGIAEIITVPGYVNVDFQDVRTVMYNSGSAVMGSSETSGEDRAERAAREALSSPLLDNKSIKGAQKILLSIISGEEAELQMDELTAITDFMQDTAGDDAEVIFGHGVDAELGDSIRVTIIATGFEQQSMILPTKEPKIEPNQAINEDTSNNEEKRIHDLDSPRQADLFGEQKIQNDLFEKRDFEVRKVEDNEKTSLEGQSYTFDFTPPSAEEKEEEQVAPMFEFENEFDIVDETPDSTDEKEDFEIEELMSGSAVPLSAKVRLIEAARERKEKLMGMKSEEIDLSKGFKEKLEQPAYLRRNVRLQKVPHSTDKNVSKFNLNDDNNLLGNNKFLHDNVD